MPISNYTHRRRIEAQIAGLMQDLAQQLGRKVRAPIPLDVIAERQLGLSYEAHVFSGALSRASAILVPDHRRILLNSDEDRRRQRFSFAHEIAHWLIEFHEPGSSPKKGWDFTFLKSPSAREREQTANYLAAALLMPKALIREHLRIAGNRRNLGEMLAGTFDVSSEALRIRIDQLALKHLLPNTELLTAFRNSTTQDAASHLNRRQSLHSSDSLLIRKRLLIIENLPFIDYGLLRRIRGRPSQPQILCAALGRDADLLAEVLIESGIAANAVQISTSDESLQMRDISPWISGNFQLETLSDEKWRTWIWHQDSEARLSEGQPSDRLGPPIVLTRSSDGRLAYRQRRLPQIPSSFEPTATLNYRRAAVSFIRKAKGEGKKVVLATGAFDLISFAHIRFLKNAKALGDVLVVGVEDDNRVRALNHFRPINGIVHRIEVLEALAETVDLSFVIFGSPKEPFPSFYTRLYKSLRPDVLAISEADPYADDRRLEIEAAGGKLEIVSRRYAISTTTLLQSALSRVPGTPALLSAPKAILLFPPQVQPPGLRQLELAW